MDVVCSSDRDLLETFVAGSAIGFEELVSRYETKVFALCNSLARTPIEAEEILADVFCEAYSVLPALDKDSSIALWLFRRTIELAVERREKFDILDGSTPIEQSANPFDTSANSAFIVAFTGIAKKLPAEYLVVFLLADILLLDLAEVSEIIETSELEVKAYLHRARLMVVRHLPTSFTATQVMSFLPVIAENSAMIPTNSATTIDSIRE